jgi:hypothetical protein
MTSMKTHLAVPLLAATLMLPLLALDGSPRNCEIATTLRKAIC